VTGNTIDISNTTSTTGILAQSAITHPSGEGASINLNVGGATAALRNTFTHSGGAVLAAGDIRVRQRFDGNFNLDGYAGTAFDNAAVVAYLNGRNTVVSASTATSDDTGGLGGPTDDPGPGYTGTVSPAFITVSVSAATVAEDGATNLTYTFTRSGSTAASLVSNFAITGTAATASDFAVTGATTYSSATGLGTVTFAAGSATTTITVDPTADGNAEANESVVVDAGNSTTANGSFARALINNDDAALFLTVATASAAREDGGVPSGTEQQQVIGAAIERLSAVGLYVNQLSMIQSATFETTDLPGGRLGSARAGQVEIDVNAARRGWFIDTSPLNDSEFELLAAGGGLRADEDSDAYGRIDLLTVVLHELGHILGLDHDEDGLMGESLETSLRHADLDALFADEGAVAALFT
jgi:hypothetical protein